MPQGHKGKTESALERTLTTMLMVIGSALPFMIAWYLIASTNEGNPLDRIPDYGDRIQETLSVPPGDAQSVRTEFEYRHEVRLIFEGTLQLPGGGERDTLYVYTSPDGEPLAEPRALDTPGLTLDGQDMARALDLTGDPPVYNNEHTYTAVYDVGGDWRRIDFGMTGTHGAGALRITVIQLE